MRSSRAGGGGGGSDPAAVPRTQPLLLAFAADPSAGWDRGPRSDCGTAVEATDAAAFVVAGKIRY